jgi:hypothetical protein
MWRGWCADAGGQCPAMDTEPRAAAPASGSVAPRLTGLSAGLVPLREFPLRRWFYADYYADKPRWYYHAPATQHRLRDDPRFYELVDPPLRAVCAALRAAGLFTTPSCAGHSYVTERFIRIWDELRRDVDTIRSSGLLIRNSERDTYALFRAADYQLPWDRRAEFLAEVDGQQHAGYLGVAVPRARAALGGRLARLGSVHPAAQIALDTELSALLGQTLVSIHVCTRSLSERTAAWNAVTDAVRTALGGPAGA